MLVANCPEAETELSNKQAQNATGAQVFGILRINGLTPARRLPIILQVAACRERYDN